MVGESKSYSLNIGPRNGHKEQKEEKNLPFLRKGVTMTHLAEEGDLTPLMEWVNNPPFLREGVASTLLTEIKGVIKSQEKS